MSRLNPRMAAWCAFAALVLSVTASTEVRAQAPAVEPDAVELLRHTMEYLGSLEQFTVDYQTTFEDLLESGHRVDFETSGSLIISRPNKLRTERHGHLIDQVFYYDGATLTLHNPSQRVYATVAAPGTIEEMFHFAHDSLGIGSPMSDLLYRDAFPLLMQDVDFAVVIGKEMIGGVVCNHLLFSRPGVDFQMWVPDSGPPLPLKYLVTDTLTPDLASVSAVLSNWNTAPDVPDTLFSFVPPEGSTKITFLGAGSGPNP